MRVREDVGVDLGPAVAPYAVALLIDGDRGVHLGGIPRDDEDVDGAGFVPPRATHDVLTPFVTTSDGPSRSAAQRRLVLPDGQELPPAATFHCRGDTLHVLTATDWYAVELEECVA